MRHGMKGRNFGRPTAHRMAMLQNMITSLLKHEQIKTTLPKAKDLRAMTDKIITLGKKGGLSNRRIALAQIPEAEIVNKVFGELATRYANRKGGYTRVLKAGIRYGDAAPMAIIELVDRDVTAKGAVDKARAAATATETEQAS